MYILHQTYNFYKINKFKVKSNSQKKIFFKGGSTIKKYRQSVKKLFSLDFYAMGYSTNFRLILKVSTKKLGSFFLQENPSEKVPLFREISFCRIIFSLFFELFFDILVFHYPGEKRSGLK